VRERVGRLAAYTLEPPGRPVSSRILLDSFDSKGPKETHQLQLRSGQHAFMEHGHRKALSHH